MLFLHEREGLATSEAKRSQGKTQTWRVRLRRRCGFLLNSGTCPHWDQLGGSLVLVELPNTGPDLIRRQQHRDSIAVQRWTGEHGPQPAPELAARPGRLQKKILRAMLVQNPVKATAPVRPQ